MSETPSERRLAENEIVFRQLNEQIHTGYAETNRLAREDSQPQFTVIHKSDDKPLYFYCECSDEKCSMRIKINVHDYHAVHQRRDQFIVVPGHEVPEIEKVVSTKPGYNVVKKLVTPPEIADTLNPTPLNHT